MHSVKTKFQYVNIDGINVWEVNDMRSISVLITIVCVVVTALYFIHKQFIVHEDVVSTVFWIGEAKDPDNDYISNGASAWDDRWQEHYGGVDDPKQRNGYFPARFRPKENPFYVALPYGDFLDGKRKDSVALITWAREKEWRDNESVCKNRWVRIAKGNKVAYAQWEDVGPLLHDDFAYVFGGAKPQNTFNAHAGIDVSPAVATYLNLRDIDRVHWNFVDRSDVPQGPWTEIITTSQITWDE